MKDLFEGLLARSRYVVLVAVVASVLTSLAAFFLSSVDVVRLLGLVMGYADTSLSSIERGELRAAIVTGIVKAIDGYLIATIMLIFGLGLYELFIEPIELLDQSGLPREVLTVRTLDQLKDKLARVVLLILVVRFLQVALEMSFGTPLELLYLAMGIVLIGAALFITAKKEFDYGRLRPGARSSDIDSPAGRLD